jgi:hypothetical protein
MFFFITHSIRARKPSLFASPVVFEKVVSVLEAHQFHHQMWVFCMNLFDKRRVLRRMVFDESDEEGGDEGSSSYQIPAYARAASQTRSTRTGTFSSNGRSTSASYRTTEEMSESGLDDDDD